MNRTPRITAIFLDIGGVILENGWDRKKRKRAAELFRLDIDEMNERHHLTFDTYEEGKLSLEDYLTRVIFYEERSFSRDEFRDFMLKSGSYPEMIELLCSLKRKYRLRIAAVSNEGRELTVHRIREFRLTDFMDFFVCSSFVHYRKPDPDIYKIALDISQAPVEEVLYIDDRAMFVEVAESLGIRGFHHVDYETTRQGLAGFGLALD